MSRIVVLGDLNLDVYAKHPGDLSPGSETRSSVWTAPGGSAGTFARTAAAEGAEVTFVGSVGNDLVGDLLIRSLEESGVTPIVRRDDRPSGTILSLQHGDERTMICSRGANDGLTAEALDETAFTDADHLHVSGYAFLSPTQRGGAERAIALAKRNGSTVSVDPPPDSLIAAFGVAAFLAELADVGWLFPNLTEGQALTGFKTPVQIADALAHAFPIGAVTLGASGALAWNRNERNLEAPGETSSRNPTGAGDAYAAAFVVAFLGGTSLQAANARGCSVAAEHIRRNAAPERLLGHPGESDDTRPLRRA